MDKDEGKTLQTRYRMERSKFVPQLYETCELIAYIGRYTVQEWIQQCEHSCRRSRFPLIPELHPEVIIHTQDSPN